MQNRQKGQPEITFKSGRGVDASGNTCTRGYSFDLCLSCQAKLSDKIMDLFSGNSDVLQVIKTFLPGIYEQEW